MLGWPLHPKQLGSPYVQQPPFWGCPLSISFLVSAVDPKVACIANRVAEIVCLWPPPEDSHIQGGGCKFKESIPDVPYFRLEGARTCDSKKGKPSLLSVLGGARARWKCVGVYVCMQPRALCLGNFSLLHSSMMETLSSSLRHQPVTQR